MLPCLKPLPSTNNCFSSPASQGYSGYSTDNTPASSVQLSPTINLTREYTLAVQTNSYREIRTTFDQSAVDTGQVKVYEETQLLEQVLRPSRKSVQEALSLIRPNPLTHLIATYFEHSEQTSSLCLLLYRRVHRARLLYAPIHNLLDDLPFDFDTGYYSLSHPQCKLAFNVFLQFFDSLENPFLSPDPHTFDDMRRCFSDLGQQLDHHLRKPQSRAKISCCWSTGPISGDASMTRKERVRLAQIEAAAKGVYVLRNDIDTIDRLVARLLGGVENDRLLIQLGLERGVDRYPIQEILKQLRRNRPSFVKQLVDLEEHLFLCFAAINRARLLLLQEIHMQQSAV